MPDDKARDYYASMLNAMRGLQADVDANDAPDTAKGLLLALIEECEEDYEARF